MWDLFWAVVVIAVVAQLCYSAGHWKGFESGVIKMRKEVERLINEEAEKMEAKEEDESKETP